MLRTWLLPFLLLCLAAISILVLRSVAPSLLPKQLIFFVLGGFTFIIASHIRFGTWLKVSPYLYGLLIGLLLITQILGKVTRGAVSWIPLGPIHIEPSQLAVVCVGLLLCKLVDKHPIQSLKSLLIFGFLSGLPAVLIFIQPDFGSTIIYIVAMASLFFLSKTKPEYLMGIFTLTIVSLFIGWNFLLLPYQKQRITSFINVSDHASAASYNAIQSVIAVGSGQVLGRGLGRGVQSHLRFLPERQTDFVFASFAEETGFIGSALIIALYASLTLFFLLIGFLSVRPAEKYFCYITATMLAIQSTVNIGMNIGLLPITGITLPLISYGGSSILSLCFQYGCVQSLIKEFKKQPSLHIR